LLSELIIREMRSGVQKRPAQEKQKAHTTGFKSHAPLGLK
jgi:hypothetical protein